MIVHATQILLLFCVLLLWGFGDRAIHARTPSPAEAVWAGAGLLAVCVAGLTFWLGLSRRRPAGFAMGVITFVIAAPMAVILAVVMFFVEWMSRLSGMSSGLVAGAVGMHVLALIAIATALLVRKSPLRG